MLERAMADDYRVGDSDRRAHGLQVSPGFSTDVVAMMWKSSTPKVVEDTSAAHDRVADWVLQTVGSLSYFSS